MRREEWKTTKLSPRYSLWRSARLSRAQLHIDWLRISGEMYGATTTSSSRNWKKRTSPLTGAESIQIRSGNGIRDPKIITSKLPCRELSRAFLANDFGSRRTGRRLGDKNAFDRPEGKVRVRVSNRDCVRQSLHSRCIRER